MQCISKQKIWNIGRLNSCITYVDIPLEFHTQYSWVKYFKLAESKVIIGLRTSVEIFKFQEEQKIK